MNWLSDGLDWLGGQFGSSSNWGSDAGSWFDKNFGGYYQTPGIVSDGKKADSGFDFGKILDSGRKLYNLWDANDARQGSRNDLAKIYSQMEQEDAAYQQQVAAYRQQQAAGAAAARRKNDAAQRKAATKAMKLQKQMFEQMIGNYQPYADAAKSITPNMAKNYNQFLDTTALLNQYLAPTVMKNMQAPMQSAYERPVSQAMTSIPVPQAEAISFPTLEEALKRGK
jgi:hypothetical protein